MTITIDIHGTSIYDPTVIFARGRVDGEKWWASYSKGIGWRTGGAQMEVVRDYLNSKLSEGE